MRIQQSIIENLPPLNIVMIDGEFDHFEMNNDLMESLCGAEVANFYHDASDIAE